MKILTALSLILCAATAAAQDPAAAVADFEDGIVAFSYPSHDGVYGNEHGIHLNFGDDEDGSWYVKGRWHDDDNRRRGDVAACCKVRKGRVRDIDFSILAADDERPYADRDLGAISAAVAAEFFLSLAESADEDAAEEALFGAILARDVDVSESVISLARDKDRPGDLRESAVFWLAVLAGAEAEKVLGGMIDDAAEDADLRAHAVFALTQLDEERAFPMLMDIARTHPHPEVRGSAFIWLAEYDRPEVVNLLEEILVGP